MSKKIVSLDKPARKKAPPLTVSFTISLKPIIEEIIQERNTIDIDYEDLTNQKLLKRPD